MTGIPLPLVTTRGVHVPLTTMGTCFTDHNTLTEGSLDHRTRMSKLREQWLGRELIDRPQPLHHMKVVSTTSTADSGLGLSPMDDIYSQESITPTAVCTGTPSGQTTPRALSLGTHIDINEEVLVATIQSEAESSQHIVDMLNSTNTMRRRKQLYDTDLTYRRRGKIAKQSLCTYAPQAPKQNVWGDIFDGMLRKLKGVPPIARDKEPEEVMSQGNVAIDYECSMYDNDSTSGSCSTQCGCSRSSSRWFPPYNTTSYHLESHSGEAADYTWVSSTVTDCITGDTDRQVSVSDIVHRDYTYCEHASTSFGANHMTSQEMTSPTLRQCELIEHTDCLCYWEENWNDQTSSTESHTEYCEGCGGYSTNDSTHVNIKPTFCYKNQNCPSFDRSSSAVCSLEPQSPMSELDVGVLQSVSFQRPDLASSLLTSPPIRKTESNKNVWIERVEGNPGPSDPTFKVDSHQTKPLASVWKRIKRIFNTR